MDTLAQLRTALTDRYEIEREIGAGGMATVYLARDPRHDRHVALKVLNPELGAVLGVERFLAEIKVTANLQHPNLLPLFDSGEAAGLLFYVMPFVEGESLRAKLEREKQLPIDEAIRIAVAVANALDYAHGHGVIHRDLKPENILLQHGQPVVADFGIALAVSKAGGNRITQTGLSLGTPQYMSPEQATGDRVIDGRSDIYSLAAVTYEMLTGEPPHTGNTAQAVIARVLTDRPRPIRASRSAVPEHVEAALEHALEKLPADRYPTAREFAEALQGRGAAVPTMSTRAARPTAPAGWRTRLRDPVVIGLTVVAVAEFGTLALRRTPNDVPPLHAIRFVVAPTDSSAPSLAVSPWPAAISDDGSKLVYGARVGSEMMLWLLRTDQVTARPIPGTGGRPQQPLFSPDGEWVLFEEGGKEMKVRLDGGAPVNIGDNANANGADWTAADDIIYGASGATHGLSVIHATGGGRTALTQPDSANGVDSHLWPIVAPDGQTVAFVLWKGALNASELELTTLKDGKVTPLGLKGIRPLAFLDGFLVYAQFDGAVMAVEIDLRRLRAVGRPIQVHDRVHVELANNGNSYVFVSRGGATVIGVGSTSSRLAWLDRDGRVTPITNESKAFFEPTIAPGAGRIGVVAFDADASDAWVFDLRARTLSRLTTAGTLVSLAWVDSTHVIYLAAGRSARAGVWLHDVTGGTPPELLLEVPDLTSEASLAPDHRTIYFQMLDGGIWRMMRATRDSAKSIVALTSATTDSRNGRPSPDDRWMAYAGRQTGRQEVYVRSLRADGTVVQVSTDGGANPTWSVDGRQLYYENGGRVLAAHLTASPGLTVVSRDTLFSLAGRAQPSAGFGSGWAPTADGRRLLILQGTSEAEQLIVSPNWITEFRERVKPRARK
jgi:Tol biopolymer transport system component